MSEHITTDRKKTETECLLEESVIEIKQLRHQNSLMAARLQMFDDVMLLFKSVPNYPTMGYSEDLVWKIERHLKNSSDASN